MESFKKIRMTRDGFRNYLETTSDIAIQNDTCDCLISNYLKAIGHDTPRVNAKTYDSYDTPDDVRLPKWAQIMVEKFDRLEFNVSMGKVILPNAYIPADFYRKPMLRAFARIKE